MSPRVVVITGTSSGLGLELAKLLLTEPNKYIVIGTSRGALGKDHELLQSKGYVHKQLDVTVDESVEAVFSEIGRENGRLDVLINNAAFGIFGTTEVSMPGVACWLKTAAALCLLLDCSTLLDNSEISSSNPSSNVVSHTV